ncbi:glycosyltransferase family 4 protein [Glutamicibacter sp. NPDC087344]|uniref:glycosyltransferase family 4 protein n=1 Tax=Glutamicibacter sp. NPDC087344 TaxID=3363994 RepID=UPI0037F191A3
MFFSKTDGEASPSLKILLLTHSFWPENSPPQRRWKSFTRSLAEAGHQVSVVTPYPKASSEYPKSHSAEQDQRIRMIRYPAFGSVTSLIGKAVRSLFHAFASVPASLRNGRQDVVIATVPALSTLFSGFAASRLLRAQFVVDLRDPWPDLFRDSKILRPRRLEPLAIRAVLYLLRKADLVVTVTEGLAHTARNQGIRHVSTIPNGVDLANYPLPRKRSENSPQRRLRVLYLGNVGLSQGLDLLIRSAAQLPGRIEVRLVGEGNDKVRLQRLASELRAPVHFFDPIRGEQVLDMYSWADTVVVSLRPDWPSFSHTVPSKLYELLALDLHVTGLVQGEAADIITDARAGQIVRQNIKALTTYFEHLLQDPLVLKASGDGPQWIARNADLARLGRQYTQQLEALIAPEASAGRVHS